LVLATISLISVTAIARERLVLIPEEILGAAPGRVMCQNARILPIRYAQEVATISGSRSSTASIALRRTGHTQTNATTEIFIVSPNPRATIAIGIKAAAGMERRKVTSGFNI